MAMFYALGNALVTEDELQEKQALGHIAKFASDLKKDRTVASLEFSTGVLTEENMLKSTVLTSGKPVIFKKIGPGLPLTIEIRHVYTGKFPESTFWSSKKQGMLVTSAMKSIATFDAAPRAVNFLEDNVHAKHDLPIPAATQQGTPLIYYSPALIERNSVLTLEMGFDEFPNEVFKMVSTALNQAAGIPIFLTASAYLLGAGAITKLLGEIGSRLFDCPPKFKATEPLTFLRPGAIPPQADFRLVLDQAVNPAVLRHYGVSQGGGLVDKKGNPYNGDIPYMIISLDGRKNPGYANFAATAASSALLERYYNIREGQDGSLVPILDAIKLYNDWKFRQKADSISTELKNLPANSDEYTEKKAEYDATVKNIMDDLLKPKN
jgi:hypothetical protein